MDRVKKVIEGLECCNQGINYADAECSKCPYAGIDNCDYELKCDALELLKAQEPMKPKVVDTSNSKLYHNDMFKNHYCGNCGEFLHVVNRKDMFCSQCGRAVKWE